MKHQVRRRLALLAITSLILIILLNLLIFGHQSYVRHTMCEGELRTADWSGKDLEGIDCAHQILREGNLSGANLRRANLQGTDFSGATYLDDADLQEADLTQSLLVGTSAVRADFSGATLNEADLSHANLNGARLTRADLQGTLLIGTHLVAADLSDLKGAPVYLDGADLTDARIEVPMTGMRLCNTTMPDGNISKQGCFTPSYSLHQSVNDKSWRSMDQDMSLMFMAAFAPIESDAYPSNHPSDVPTTEQIRSIPCPHLHNLDQLWRRASGDRFGLRIQRQLWESADVNQDYVQFGERVGWKQNGTWLKFLDLPTQVPSMALPLGMFPWHGWQVQEPTLEEPTRFRRVGFGEWMARVKACGL